MLLWMRERSPVWYGEGVLVIKNPYGNVGPLFFRIDWHFFPIDSSLQIQQSVFLDGIKTKSLLSMILREEFRVKVSLTGEDRPHMQGGGYLSLTEAAWTLHEVGNVAVIGQERHWRDDRENCYFEAFYGLVDHRTEIKGIWSTSRPPF